MDQAPIRVAIGGGCPLDRAGHMALVASLPGLRVVTLDADPPPRVILWDTASDDLRGLPLFAQQSSLLLLTSEARLISLPPGIAGLFSKDESPEALGIAIRQVARGEQYLSPSLALSLLQSRTADAPRPEVDMEALTDRERDVLRLLAEGLSNKAIAARLYLSVRTVEGHLANAYTRLGVHSRTEAALIAVRLTSPTTTR